MAALRPGRTQLGEHFSEGARLLWLGMHRKGWSQAKLRSKLGAGTGMVNRWLFGDVRPSIESAVKLRKLFGIAIDRWAEEPTEAFTVIPLPAGVRTRKAA